MLKLSSCSAAQVPSSGACGWNTTQSQHVPAGNFLSNFPHPHLLCQRSLSPPLSPPLHLRSMMWFFKTPDKGLVMKLFYWGLFKSETLWRSTKNLLWWFFNFQFLCPQAPHFDICLPVSLFMTYFFLLAGSEWIWKLCEVSKYFCLWIPSLWHIIPSLYKCSCWIHDT